MPVDVSNHGQILIERLVMAGCSDDYARARAAVYVAASNALNGLSKQNAASADSRAAFLVPGRIEFLGKHTDYAGGRSLLCAVDRGFAFVASPRMDRTVRVTDSSGGSAVSFVLDANLETTAGHWSNYAITVARRIADNFGGELLGADIAFASDLPQSSGMSSSSALIVGFFLVLAKVNHLGLRSEFSRNIHSIEDLAGYLGTVENGQTFRSLVGDRGVGTFGGSEDHTAILCSKPGFLRQYAFCPVRLEDEIPLPPGHVLAVGSSGVVAEKTVAVRDAYNSLSQSVHAILALWNEKTGSKDASLADVVERGDDAIDQLRSIIDSSTDAHLIRGRLHRLEQFIVENTIIIPGAAAALKKGRLEDVGWLVAMSQDLAERMLKNQSPETVFLAKTAKDYGAVAASAFGAGFGGSVWALVPRIKAESFLHAWQQRYAENFPTRQRASQFFLTGQGQPVLDLSDASRSVYSVQQSLASL